MYYSVSSTGILRKRNTKRCKATADSWVLTQSLLWHYHLNQSISSSRRLGSSRNELPPTWPTRPSVLRDEPKRSVTNTNLIGPKTRSPAVLDCYECRSMRATMRDRWIRIFFQNFNSRNHLYQVCVASLSQSILFRWICLNLLRASSFHRLIEVIFTLCVIM